MVEISLSGMPAARPGDPGDPGGVAALRDGSRLVLRVSRDLGGGRAVLEGAGLRLEAELPFQFARGSLIEAVVRSGADGVLIEILGESPSAGAAGAAGRGPAAGARSADAAEILASLGLADTEANRAAATALLSEGEALTEAAVREAAAALEAAGEISAERARAVVRLLAAGIPPAASLQSAISGEGDLAAHLGEAAAALGELAATDAALADLASAIASLGVEPGEAASARAYFEGAAGRLLEALAVVEARAAESMASERLASLDRLIEMVAPRAAASPAAGGTPPLETLIAADGSLAPDAGELTSALSPGAAAALLETLLEAERAEISRARVPAALARAARALRGALSRAALPRAAALAGWGSGRPGATGPGGLVLEIPVADGARRIVMRLRIREAPRRDEKGRGADAARAWRVAVGVTMSVLGPVLAELKLRSKSLDGVIRLTTPEAVRAVESRLDELTSRLAEEGLAASITVEEASGGSGADDLAGRQVSPDVRKVDLTI